MRRMLLAGLAAFAFTLPAAGRQQDEKKFTFNFKDAPVDQVLAYVSEVSGWKFVFDGDAKSSGTVTAISDGAVGPEQALVIIDAALKQHGLATVNLFSPRLPKAGEVVRIMTVEKAKNKSLEIHYGSDPEKIPPTDKVITQIIPLKGANVLDVQKELGETIKKCVEEGGGSMAINSYSNSIILIGRSEGINRAARILQVIDVKASEELKTEVFPLKNADATETTKVLNEVFKKETTNAARDANPFGNMMRFFGGGGKGGGGDQPQPKTVASEIVRIVPETRTNSVICVATADNMKTITTLVSKLDEKSTELIKLRHYPLRYADAKEVANLITDIFSEEGANSSTGRSGNNPRSGRNPFQPFWMGGQQPPTDTSVATSREVRAVADVRTNSVVVAASEKNFKVIDQMVEQLDRLISDVTEVKVYKLKNATATDMVTILKEVFKPQINMSQNAGRPQQGQQQQNPFMRFFGQQGSASGTQQVSPNQEVEISADSRTNSVIVKASTDYLLIVDKLIDQLDKDATESLSTFVVPLRNANAANLATVMRDLIRGSATSSLQQNRTGTGFGGQGTNNNQSTRNNQNNSTRQQGFGSTGTRGNLGPLDSKPQDTPATAPQDQSGQDELERLRGIQGQADFQADPSTNSLIVRTSPRNFRSIQNIIQDLDRMRPQVLIRCLIADVTLTGDLEFGVQSSWENQVTVPHQPANQKFSTSFDLPTQGFSYLLSGNGFQESIKAFAKDGRLKILATPRILVLDNEQADINIGKQVPIITNSTVNQLGNTVNTVQYQNIGILLNVTPHINPDGLVTLFIHPEVSDLASQAESVVITPGATSPTFIINSADTTVSVRNGTTVVIGGLIRETLDDSVEKIPILGDIPVIGLLFSSTTKKKLKRELMIFLTPYVAYTAAELEEITELEKARLNLIEPKDIEAESDKWLEKVRH